MTYEELKERQSWTLEQKIDHTLGVIEQFRNHYDGKVYVAFSGGKDSCVMLNLVELIIPNVPCMFIMTGCESPSVCRFVRQMKQEAIATNILNLAMKGDVKAAQYIQNIQMRAKIMKKK